MVMEITGKIMVLEIDTILKAIKIKGSCSVQEFISELNKLFPDFDWSEWIITEYPMIESSYWKQWQGVTSKPFLPYTDPGWKISPFGNPPVNPGTGDPDWGTIICTTDSSDSDRYKLDTLRKLAGQGNTAISMNDLTNTLRDTGKEDKEA